jgi:hypothetical protein
VDRDGALGPCSEQAPLRALFIGGGSYTLPRYLAAVYPGIAIDVLEIDPEVTAVAQEHLGLVLGRPAAMAAPARATRGAPTGDSEGAPIPGGAIQVYHGDARLSLRRLPAGTYHLVVGDAFSDYSVPWHLTTLEFDRDVRRVLRPDGVYAVNIIDVFPSGPFLAAYTRTLGEVFPAVALVDVQTGGRDTGQGGREVLANWLVIGTHAPLDAPGLERSTRPGVGGPEPARARLVDPAEVERLLAAARPAALLLTDDHAPVDYYLARRTLGP